MSLDQIRELLAAIVLFLSSMGFHAPGQTTASSWDDLVVAAERDSGYVRPSGSHGGKCSAGQDLDHVVPLAEAWQSGVNDLASFNRDKSNHRCLPASVNRSKGSSEPHEWLSKPKAGKWLKDNASTCRSMVDQWKAVKVKYNMTVDMAEKKGIGTACLSAKSGSTERQEPKTKTTQPKQGGCTHWHSGHPKHTHPGTGHDGSHKSGKCKGY